MPLDRITRNLLKTFVTSEGLEKLPESDAFERFAGPGPSAANPELVERIGSRLLQLLSAGRGTEAREYQRRARGSAALWNLSNASHAAALRTDPAGYERRVIGFLDRALLE